MASVTVERVAAVQTDILNALLKSSAGSNLSAADQSQLLAQSCAETCDLLQDWLDSGWFAQRGPADDRRVADTVPSPEQFAGFLGPSFADTLAWLDRCGIKIDPTQLERARAGVAALSRRYRRMKRVQLRQAAQERVQSLAREVCQASAQLRIATAVTSDETAGRAWRHKAGRALKKAATSLPAIALSVALTSGPHQVEQSVSAWVHDAAAEVVLMYHVAEQTQPGYAISPPRLGREAEFS